MAHPLRSVLWSIAGILLCGLTGALCGWGLVTVLGLSGVPAALLGAIIGMVVATAAWVGLTYALRKLGAPNA
jgi:hypothetical protein